ncbi:protein NETWORKED 2A [Vitis riparia]|uniref:protein NETWORKED 2A n=1 Tax=Vitis riparia TaxID=96939 RepID=UPI00155A36B9|nr:protein NETWORKED 2A [Vitis riparia]
MLHRAATNAYSWWWASHIRTKQSKWLEQNLHDVEEKVQFMLKIIDDDGDSFAQRAEMYYRKRPELINLVEEYFRAYRAIAERYDHLSRELQHANRTIATVYPEKVQFAMDDEEENVPKGSGDTLPKALPSLPKSTIPKIPNIPKKDFLVPTPAISKRKQLKKTISSIIAATCSGLSKIEALDEIDKLQKEILMLQTEKEFVKSSYERGAARYWEIESQITEMQSRVSDLQDEFGIGTVIEDDEARSLMSTTALKSCQGTLAQLQEKQERVAEEARVERQKLKETREKLQALKHQFLPNQTQQPQHSQDHETLSHQFLPNQMEELELSTEQESPTTSVDMDLELLREKIKEQLELNSKTTVTAPDVAERIDELVEKVITLEAAVSSQTALVRRLRLETDELQTHVQTLEEDKETLIEDSDKMSTKLIELEEELSRVQSLNRSVEDQNKHLQTHFTEASYALDHLSEKLQGVKLVMEAKDMTWFQEERAVSDILTEKEFEEHEDLLPQGNGSALSEDITHEEGKKDENPDYSSSVKAEEENFTQYNPGNILVTSENMKTGNQEEKGHVPDLSHSAKAPDTPEKGEELKEQKEDEKQELGYPVDSNSDIEDQDLGMEEGDQPNWRQLFINGLEHREKTLLDEYTSILRSYKEVKKKLTEAEKKNRDSFFESALQIRELKNANALKDEEIRSLRQNISPQTNPGENWDTSLTEDKPSQQGEAHASISREASSKFSNIPSLNPEQQSVTGSLDNQSIQGKEESMASGSMKKSPTKSEQGEIKEIPVDESLAVVTTEEKIRADIDDILEENLEFWLRFSTSYHQVQKFQTSIQDLQAELLKLKEDKKNEGGTKQQSTKSDARPIYTHMREIQTELSLWLEHNALLKEELQGRFSSLCNLQEEISRILDADSNAQEAELSYYQAAKFQGELLNMKQENKKVKEELQKGLDRVRALQLEVERTLSQLDEDFEISKSKSHPSNWKNSVNRTRIPLRSFLFGVKLKKQKPSFFACMSPTLQKQYSDLTAGLPP